jgi:AbrB family looped-hinge helix DNA binding protein
MATAMISSKWQITLPAAARRKLNLKPNTPIDVLVQDDQIVLRPVKTLTELYGVFHDYALGETQDWETVRALTERAVAEEVERECRE